MVTIKEFTTISMLNKMYLLKNILVVMELKH